MADPADHLLGRLLKDVSRSFYLTLRVLPKSIRAQVGLAYLLARTTDTIADSDLISVPQRLSALEAFRDRILGAGAAPVDLGGLARNSGAAAERVLLEKCEASLQLLQKFSPADRELIRDLLRIITSGQELDLRRFAGASPAHMIALLAEQELDDYTYRVAGCVGEFWTKICRAHLFPSERLDESGLLTKGVQFGKGLQLVNILRDLPADLQKGRCYLPGNELSALGLTPHDLLRPANEPRLRPVFDKYLRIAEGYLAAGWEYTNTLPWRQARVRLACVWPILIGAKTLQRLHSANILDARQRVKIPRAEVRQIIAKSILCYPWPLLWRNLFPLGPARTGKAVAS